MSFGDMNRVNTNLQSMVSQYSLNKVNDQLAKNQLQLSTGLRINKAEDDAAGFSIASKLSSRIEGLEQAERNVGDAKSVLDIAETGLSSVMDMLIDMKSKAVQGANDTLGAEERGFIGDQIESLANQINTIAKQTTYQGIELLGELNATDDGFDPQAMTFQVGEGSGDTLDVSINAISVNELFGAALDIESANGALDTVIATDVDDVNGRGGLAVDSDNITSYGFRQFIDTIDSAIETMAGNFNSLGINQTKLSIREENLSQAITSNSAARSRIQDADFAKAQSESVKLQILQQTATSALAQANVGPQSVLGFLG